MQKTDVPRQAQVSIEVIFFLPGPAKEFLLG